MLAGKPDAGNPHVRFDEGEQRDWRKPPVALYSTGSSPYVFPRFIVSRIPWRLWQGSQFPQRAEGVDDGFDLFGAFAVFAAEAGGEGFGGGGGVGGQEVADEGDLLWPAVWRRMSASPA
jgi:hypothetical protein